MKYLIVNGDDFGVSEGVNCGIARAHREGVLTSTSLMVTAQSTVEAAAMSRDMPELGVGLHAVLTSEDFHPLLDFDDPVACREELLRQLDTFERLMNRPPTHLDAHHNIHRDRRLTPVFRAIAAERNLPLREHSRVRYFPGFYGQWDNGETHLEQVSVEMLCNILLTELHTEVTELACHPGYVDPQFATSYSSERAAELRTLCDPRVRETVAALHIDLINYTEWRELERRHQAEGGSS
jgi:predicted glycoside hydrolase/deacetylase ChbG (UPF0249 family)